MKLFDPDAYLNHVVTAEHARAIADISDDIICNASFLLYGRYVAGKYIDLSCEQKPGDTIVLFGLLPKRLTKEK